MLKESRLSLHVTALVCLGLVAGCSGDARVSVVQGTVTLDGKPVADASVTFMPTEGGRPAFGITDASGKFQLSTFATGDGALLGIHTVTIMAVDEQVSSKTEKLAEEYGSLTEVMRPNARPKQVWRTPQRYSEAETSGLEFEVKRGENQADFALQSE